MFVQYPKVEVEDDRYLFAVGRIRALESKLLTHHHWERMIEAENGVEVIRVLQDTSYGKYEISDPSDFERMLIAVREDLYILMEELLVDEELLTTLRAFEDFHNLKVLLKAQIEEIDVPKDALFLHGNVSANELQSLLEEERYSALPMYLQDAIGRALDAHLGKKDVAEAIDRSYIDFMLCAPHPFIRVYFRLYVDLLNISTILRQKRTDKPKPEYLVNGGFIPVQKIAHLPSESWEAIVEAYYPTPYYNVVNEGVQSLKQKGTFLRFEKERECYLLGFLKKVRLCTMGAEPVLAYYFWVREEEKFLRLIMVAKVNGVPPDRIRERIPEM